VISRFSQHFACFSVVCDSFPFLSANNITDAGYMKPFSFVWVGLLILLFFFGFMPILSHAIIVRHDRDKQTFLSLEQVGKAVWTPDELPWVKS
jgi:hypothetical protein